MSAVRLLDEVRAALARSGHGDCDVWDAARNRGEDPAVVVATSEEIPIQIRAAQTAHIASVLSTAGFHCTRSRTRVRVRPEPETLGPPDFVCRRKP